MPSASDHLKLAQHNADTIQHLLTGEGGFPDWVATVAFYQALHLIEALIHNDFGQHGQNHKHRGDILKRENRYQKINQHCQVLQEASYVGTGT